MSSRAPQQHRSSHHQHHISTQASIVSIKDKLPSLLSTPQPVINIMKTFSRIAVCVAALASPCNAFLPPLTTSTTASSSTCLAASHNTNANSSPLQSRSQFLTKAFFLGGAALVATTTQPANAAEPDPALKGTKKDPGYEACVSKCMYECTKPKGMEQKSRGECLPDCKKECATTKAQLMIGTPLAK